MLGHNSGSTDQLLFSDASSLSTVTGALGTEFSQDYILACIWRGPRIASRPDLQLRYDQTNFNCRNRLFPAHRLALTG